MEAKAFEQRVTAAFAPDGAAWLAHLPALIAHYAERWNIRVAPAFPNLSYNYVAPAVRADGTPAVLKLGVPRRELTTEIAALELYAGMGACRVLEADAPGGALLLERLEPGADLTALAEEQATDQAAQVMQQIHRAPPAGHAFPHVSDWLRGLHNVRPHFGGGTGPFPEALLALTEQWSAELLATRPADVLLHGDLHHFNILRSARGWLAIDPKGVIGEPAYEVGALLRNPIPAILHQPDRPGVLQRRASRLAAALGLDAGRVLRWAAVQAVLAAWWDIEDGAPDTAQPWITLAEELAALAQRPNPPAR